MPKTSRSVDLSGQKFGKLLAIRQQGVSKGLARVALWQCLCDCGEQGIFYGTQLRAGKTVCCRKCTFSKTAVARTTHGETGSPTYISWRAMRARCENPKDPSHPSYGGKGIKVCPEWKSFENFLSDMGERPAGTSIDRFPNKEGNYEPGNCRWASPQEQASNKSTNKNFIFKGKAMTISEIARQVGMDRRTARYWLLVRGMSPERLMTVIKEGGQSKVEGALS